MKQSLSKRRQTDRVSPKVERETPKRQTAIIEDVADIQAVLKYRAKEIYKKDWHDKNRGLVEIRWYFIGVCTICFVQVYEPGSWDDGNYAVRVHDETHWFQTEKGLHKFILELLKP